ncbi:MAG TPA: hypothetical protein VIO38_17305 [Rariglobus sp.]
MTTIATDGKSMAGDGLVNACQIVTGRSQRKVFRLQDGRIFGGCGKVPDVLRVRDWLNGKADQPTVDEDFGAIVISRHGGIEWTDDSLCFHQVDTPAAIGSGMDLALGAMEAGCGPSAAVEIAARRDPHTGGTITVEDL